MVSDLMLSLLRHAVGQTDGPFALAWPDVFEVPQ